MASRLKKSTTQTKKTTAAFARKIMRVSIGLEATGGPREARVTRAARISGDSRERSISDAKTSKGEQEKSSR